ncbi:hypothetical protein [Chitinibacter sp. ZOR0017]|uniref:hypothetical protein n=1 Tax=Chitinibacter sp. ZOR0017 TaxID=1339254 RepID=UPI0006468904|nr:hypothetical protein [Chitinibacter sp. ZOR0017]
MSEAQDLLHTLAELDLRLDSDPAYVRAAAPELLKAIRRAKQSEWLGLTHLLQARASYQLGEVPLACEQMQQAIRAYQRQQQLHPQLQCHDELANWLYSQLDYFRALDEWLKALEIATQLQATEGCIRAYIGVGKVHLAFGDDARAMECQQIAQQLCQPLADAQLDCEVNLNIATSAYRLGDDHLAASALQLVEQALAKHSLPPAWAAEALTVRGLLALRQTQYEEAQELLSQAYQRYRQLQQLAGQGRVMLALARSFRALQQQDLAEECLEEAARLGAAGQWPEISIEAHSQLAELYIDAGRYQPALVHRKALHALIAAQHQERGQPLQLPRQATSQLRKLERELETHKCWLRLRKTAPTRH